jgi:predicted TIM-barrel fold metal-dependent hydrolase
VQKNSRLLLATNGLQGVGEVARAVALLGAERVVFASGVPHRALGATLALHRHAGLTPEQENLVMGGNTKKLMAAAATGTAGGTA